MKRLLTTLIVSLPLLLATAPANAADEAKAEVKKSYPLKTCVVSDETLGEMGKPFVTEYEGQEMKFCCKDCYKKCKKDPAKYLKKLHEKAEGKASEAHKSQH